MTNARTAVSEPEILQSCCELQEEVLTDCLGVYHGECCKQSPCSEDTLVYSDDVMAQAKKSSSCKCITKIGAINYQVYQ